MEQQIKKISKKQPTEPKQTKTPNQNILEGYSFLSCTCRSHCQSHLAWNKYCSPVESICCLGAYCSVL